MSLVLDASMAVSWLFNDELSAAGEARAGIGRYIAFYNAVRPRSALGGRTPDQACFGQPLLAAA